MAAAQLGVLQVATEGGGQGLPVAHRHQGAGDAVLDRVDGAGGGVGGHRQLAGGGFQRRVGKALAIGRKGQQIHGPVEGRAVGGERVHDDASPPAEPLADAGGERVAALEVADEEQPGVRAADAHRIEGQGEVGDALVAGEAADEADHRRRGGEAELTTQLRGLVRRRRPEAVEVDTVR